MKNVPRKKEAENTKSNEAFQSTKHHVIFLKPFATG
jgi:hypothetical protein